MRADHTTQGMVQYPTHTAINPPNVLRLTCLLDRDAYGCSPEPAGQCLSELGILGVLHLAAQAASTLESQADRSAGQRDAIASQPRSQATFSQACAHRLERPSLSASNAWSVDCMRDALAWGRHFRTFQCD